MDTDTNYRSIADVHGYALTDEEIIPGLDGLRSSDFDDLLKLSKVTRFVGTNLTIEGSPKENFIDMNRRCVDVEINGARLVGSAPCAIVIKGESQDITLRNVVIAARTTQCDIELGGWSDQAFGKTKRVILENVARADGTPVRVIVGRADNPIVIGGNVKILRFQSLALQAYWWAKYAYVSMTKGVV